ncbi:TetR/AcrR family transcriptional regulator [Pseudomonas sp. SWRI74]|uniref:TetR/AcrR family transcriptional regulator n=1 Tax=Pseudomonas azerbaijanoccidentalis TaxID=2842347 RepID=A0ABS6QWD0_9PSED|nr:TetR/AcrR family transcriptional regulator [Pseudomonas azerbaijanoccidentalis]MBV4523233.1 TetR/AcrR family transcriptional regulator [Pseudomonas azerbaijanoccidentalis]
MLDQRVVSTEEHVRRIACKLFVDEGFHQVSMRRLAAALGIQAGSLYYHMESKQALLFDVIVGYESQLLDEVRGFTKAADGPVDALLRYVETVIRFKLRYRYAALLSRLEMRSLNTAQRDVIQALRREHCERLRVMLASRKEPAAFTCADDFLERCILALLDGVIDLNEADPAAPLHRIIHDYQALIVNTLGLTSRH